MTQLLQQAIAAIQQLPDDKQDAMASLILDEIASDKRWDEAFARTEDKLAKMAEKVRSDIAQGRTVAKGFDEL
jgi:hypothetical protein